MRSIAPPHACIAPYDVVDGAQNHNEVHAQHPHTQPVTNFSWVLTPSGGYLTNGFHIPSINGLALRVARSIFCVRKEELVHGPLHNKGHL